ncbi:MAG: Zn-ribbon domain-containing OB-fold protein [Candidatus Rokubacteria bacterium]|nr:Zn-ribbon domain-containing OB-fold protein [Candidatus Rokubacteria bacterium]
MSGLSLKEFFDAVREGHLLAQRCAGCRELAIPPKAFCPSCHGKEWERVELSGKGEIASYTIIRVPPASLAGQAPYAVAVVRMAEGVSLLGRLVDFPLEAIKVGLPVVFTPLIQGDQPLIAFKPS